MIIFMDFVFDINSIYYNCQQITKSRFKGGGENMSLRLEDQENEEEQPNAETIDAMLEAERIAKDPSVKRYDVEEALQALKE